MFIESIILHNYRAYKGHNKTSFKQDAKNIFLVAGNNGFGKTTFLTSLVWCLYGKLMVDVDEKFRRDINDAQGYKNYARQSLHKELASVVNTYEASPEVRKRIIKHGYSSESEYIKNDAQYYVEISISDIFIPSIPCRTITIRRTYDYFLDTKLRILKTDINTPTLNNNKMFMALTDKMVNSKRIFFTNPHTTRVIWSMHRLIYIFTDTLGANTLYYDLELTHKIPNSTGGHSIKSTTIITKDKIFVPIVEELYDYFDLKTDEKLKFYVHFDEINND